MSKEVLWRDHLNRLAAYGDRDGDGKIVAGERSLLDADGDRQLDHPPDLSLLPPDECSAASIEILLKTGLAAPRCPFRIQIPSGTDARVDVEKVPPAGQARVFFIRQIHDRPELSDRQRRGVGDYQFEILKLLAAMKPREVFEEGRCEAFSTFLATYPRITEAFPGGEVPEAPTGEQRGVLAEYGAALVYAHLFEFVALRPTAPSCEVEDGLHGLIAGAPSKAIRDSLVYDVREAFAVQEILRFLAANPREDVVLIYGGLHEFKPEFGAMESGPGLVTVNFPSARERWMRIGSDEPFFSSMALGAWILLALLSPHGSGRP